MLYPEYPLEGVHIQVGLGQQLLALGVFRFKPAQVLSLGGLHASEFGTQLVKGHVTEAPVATNLLNRDTGLRLPEKANDLLLGKLALFMSVIFLVDGLHYLHAGTAGRGQLSPSKVKNFGVKNIG